MSWNSSLKRKGGCARQRAQCRQRYGVREVPNSIWAYGCQPPRTALTVQKSSHQLHVVTSALNVAGPN